MKIIIDQNTSRVTLEENSGTTTFTNSIDAYLLSQILLELRLARQDTSRYSLPGKFAHTVDLYAMRAQIATPPRPPTDVPEFEQVATPEGDRGPMPVTREQAWKRVSNVRIGAHPRQPGKHFAGNRGNDTMDEPRRTWRVVLEMDVHGDPHKWDWRDMLDLDPSELLDIKTILEKGMEP